MKCTIDEFTFSSDFDSGNCERVEKLFSTSTCTFFKVWTKPDCYGTKFEATNRTWFYFSVQGGKQGKFISITICDLHGNKKLFNQGLRIVTKSVPSRPKWVRSKQPCSFVANAKNFSITFKHKFEADNDTTYFALCYPYSYEECQTRLKELDIKFANEPQRDSKKTEIFYQRELLINSCQGRRVDLITISSTKNIYWDRREKTIEGLFPEGKPRPYTFCNKPVFFVTARVHPGETPGAHIFNGLLEFLISDDPRAKLLLDKFVFKLIPMLNPDGVANGHYRLDTNGVNLNRCYTNPDSKLHPSIFATKKVLCQLSELKILKFYIDLHGHASKRGCFIYGNSLKEPVSQVLNLLYPKLVALNTQHFDFSSCNFTQRNMFRKDRYGLPKTGAGRVALYLETGLINCYTLECNYNAGKRVNNLCTIKNENSCLQQLKPYRKPPIFTLEIFHDIGRGLAIAALDFIDFNPHSRLANSSFRSVLGVKEHVMKTFDSKRMRHRRPKLIKKSFSAKKRKLVNDKRVY